jgi:PAS domain-containing protein
MDMRESLTVRTVTALQRLADLEERGKTLAGPKAGVLKTALRELETALEELRVASEQLNIMVDEMAEVRSDAKKVEAEFDEFRELLPLGCVLTDTDGTILQANGAAGDLLNVAPRHLVGKPLSLYMVDRDRFFKMISMIRLSPERLTNELAVRPRERKPRVMSLQLGRGRASSDLYWFFQEPASVVTPP